MMPTICTVGARTEIDQHHSTFSNFSVVGRTAAEVARTMEIGNLAQWVGAGVTFLAVLVALFKDSIINWSRRPVLVLSPIAPPHCHKLPVRYWTQRVAPTHVVTQGYFFRLWIKNDGKARADQVQVFASKLSRRAADGNFKEDSRFLPMNLLWSHYPEETRTVYAEGISAKMCLG